MSDYLDPNKEIKNPVFDAGDGVAICAEFTGFGANKMGNSTLMMKSVEDKLGMDLRKAYRHVRVTLSMEDFLGKFFGMWYEDAKLLSQVLGYEVEDTEYGSDYYQAQLEDKVNSIELLKTVKTEEDFFKLEPTVQNSIVALQAQFEKGLDSGTFSGDKPLAKKANVIVNDDLINSENEESKDMSESMEVKMQKMQATLEASEARAKALEAKAELKEKEVLLSKVADLEFMKEESIADMIKSTSVESLTSYVVLLGKAQDLIRAKDEKLAELEGEVVRLKKQAEDAEDTFMGKPLSVSGDANDEDEDSREKRMIKSLKKINKIA